jgi:hypothetical protein
VFQLWGSLASCVTVVNRHAGRLTIGPQVINLPHRRTAELNYAAAGECAQRGIIEPEQVTQRGR